MNVAGIVLAAGSSRRLGRPKQTVEIGGEILLHRAIRIAREAGLRPVFVVLDSEGRFAANVRNAGASIVLNHEAEEGISSSIRAGVRAASALPDVAGAVLMTCDQIGATPEHLIELCAELQSVTGSGYAGKPGVPAYFPREVFPQLLTLQGDTGARDLLRGARFVVCEALALDIDTPQDVVRAQSLFPAATGQGE